MTTRTWNGASDVFSNAADWSPNGVPVSGDIAVINSGTVAAVGSDFVPNLGISISSGANATNLIISSATIQATDAIAGTVAGAANLTLGIQGGVTNAGVATFLQSGTGNDIVGLLDAASGATTLTNTGVLAFDTTIGQIRNLGTNVNNLVNNGVIALRDASSTSKLVYDTVPISGIGVVRVGAGYTFQTTSTISGQNIYLQAANGVGANAEFDNAVGNTSVISNFTASDQIILTSPGYNGSTLTNANGQTLVTFTNNGATVGQFTLQGTYASNQINISNSSTNAGVTSFVTTTVADTVTTGSVYRFFDKTTGTHFFTADAGEKNSVIANVPNLVEETNGFGNVVQSDPNSEAVYRFFDNIHGTHFFTASASERDTIINTRSDLKYEPSSTFFENSVNLPGDVAVYRFFDKTFGTHFYTGDQNEFNGLTTQGSSTFRSDLTFEGVSFYAPSGSFR